MRQSPATPLGTPPAGAHVQPTAVEPRASKEHDQRRLSRVALTISARIRWLGPFGLETEVTQTVNASRGGLLIFSGQPRGENSPVWVTFPFDAKTVTVEPEIPGRVARCIVSPAGTHAIGIEFERRRPPGPRSMRADRRRHTRFPLALFVRIIHIECIGAAENPTRKAPPWPEETMTVDVSPDGLLFRTLRIYAGDERVAIAMPGDRGFTTGERSARVVRVAGLELDSPLQQVAVEFLS